MSYSNSQKVFDTTHDVVLKLLHGDGSCSGVTIEDCTTCICDAACQKMTGARRSLEYMEKKCYEMVKNYIHERPEEFLNELL